MSTHTSSEGTPLTISEPQQNLRLLELPPELLDLLSTPHPPKLYFKSSSSRTSNSNGSSSSSALSTPTSKTAEYLHLCTPNQTYQVRQVSTSNSVYVLQPSITRLPESADGDASINPPPNGDMAMTAISSIDTILELLPVNPAIKPMLQHILPIYDPASLILSEGDKISGFLSPSSSNPNSKSTILADIPAPIPQIESTWREILAFEFQGRCARPASATALEVWKAVLDYAILERLNLASSSGVDLTSFFSSAQQGEETSPLDKAIAEAVLLYLDNSDKNTNNTTTSSSYLILLDQTKTVKWTGATLLQSLSLSPSQTAAIDSASADAGVGVGLDDYLSQWRDLLPEKWRGDVGLDKLAKGCYSVTTSASVTGDGDSGERREVVVWNGDGDGDADGMGGQGGLSGQMTGGGKANANANPTATTTGGKRKWHEKFKAQRKEVKR